MFTSVQNAIDVINQRETTPSDYLSACEFLVEHRGDLRQRVFICLPGGLSGNHNNAWNAVKTGSQERCSCGNERVIIPLSPRTEFEAASDQLVVSPGKRVYLKPIGGDKASAYVCLDVEDKALTFLEDPFAPFVLTLDIFSSKGYKLEQLADVLPTQLKPPVFVRKFAGAATPIFAINAVDMKSNAVTITLDVDVEAFNPDELPSHTCI